MCLCSGPEYLTTSTTKLHDWQVTLMQLNARGTFSGLIKRSLTSFTYSKLLTWKLTNWSSREMAAPATNLMNMWTDCICSAGFTTSNTTTWPFRLMSRVWITSMALIKSESRICPKASTSSTIKTKRWAMNESSCRLCMSSKTTSSGLELSSRCSSQDSNPNPTESKCSYWVESGRNSCVHTL